MIGRYLRRSIASARALLGLDRNRATGLDPARAAALLQALKAAVTPHAIDAATDRALEFLALQQERLRVLAKSYPRDPISAGIWLDGTILTSICDATTDALGDKGRRRAQEYASRLAVAMACTVTGHYPDQMFGRVLRNARCREAIDDVDGAIGAYRAIIGDFDELHLRELLQDEDPLDETSREILTSVHAAAQRLVELDQDRDEVLSRLALDCDRRLSR